MKLHNSFFILPFICIEIFSCLTFVPSARAAEVMSGFFKENALVDDYFQVEYSVLLAAQDDYDSNGIPDTVEMVLEAAEYSREVILGDLKYADPMSGYDRPLIIILDDSDSYLSPGALGVTGLLSNGDPYIAIDPAMPDDYLKITIAHEFFHAVQFGYDADFADVYQSVNIKWAEATANWIEDIVYDGINNYVNYLTDFFSYPDYSVFASASPEDTLFEYSLSIWPRFLSEYYGNYAIKDIFTDYFDSSISYSNDLKVYDAVNNVVEDEGDDLGSVFQEFTLWNLNTANYEEGHLYPDIFTIFAEETGSDYAMVEDAYAPALFGTNYLYFDKTGGADIFYFNLVKPDDISFAVSLVPYYSSGVDLSKAVSEIIDDNFVADEPFELKDIAEALGVYVVVSPVERQFASSYNTGVFDEGYKYYFLANYVESLVLNVKSYNESSVTLSWNRLNVPDVVSYELRYGLESGKYTNSKFINKNHITAAHVTGLNEGETYYFELSALDEAGKIVSIGSGDWQGDNPSQEISLTPNKWLFTDVPYMHENYSAILALSELGILNGYSNGSFMPEQEVNRAELLKILIEARGIVLSKDDYKNCFKDVGEDWYAKYVCYAKNEGWVNGYADGTFKPSQSVNKVEALKILFQVYETGLSDGETVAELVYSDLDPNAWYAIYVWEASKLGILEESPDDDFYPTAYRNRGDIAEEVYRYLMKS